MSDKIKVVYNWIGPKGPLWNTELPSILSLAFESEHAQADGRYITPDSVWRQLFSNAPDLFELCPTVSIDPEDDCHFIIPYTLLWRIDFENYFRGRTGLLEFAHVSWHLIRLVRMKNGYILIDHGIEAFMSNRQLDALHGYFDTIHGIPLHKIIYMTGAVNAHALYEEYCKTNNIPDDPSRRLTIIPYASSSYIFKENMEEVDGEPEYNTEIVPEKLFLMWNRRFRWHRVAVVTLLENHGLIDRSYISFSQYDLECPTVTYMSEAKNNNVESDFGISPDVIERFNNKLPLTIDGETSISQMCGDPENKSRPFYQNSLISIVTETNYEAAEVTLTEKSFKPFKEKHPFITIAGSGALAFLHSLGFKTFSEFWPEDYDTISNPHQRMHRLNAVFAEIGAWSPEQIIDFRRRVKPILEHNFNVLKGLNVRQVLENINNIVRK